MIRQLCIVAAAAFFAACSQPAGPPVAMSDVRILAPMPGAKAGVAYMTVANGSDEPIAITNVRSPQFERVEMHETKIMDGVSRMRSLDTVVIPGGESVAFEPGGKHLMLIGMDPGAGPGSSVTIELVYSDGLLVVNAKMQDRLPAR
jgi:copper(I)-binding protein